MVDDKVCGNVLATIGTVLWCIQLIPQIIRNYRFKTCEGLNPFMFFIFAVSGVFSSIYFVSKSSSIPLQIQPQLFTLFSLITWIQCLYYSPVEMNFKYKGNTIIQGFVIMSIIVEVTFIIFVRRAYNDGIEWPSMIFGITSSVLQFVGFFPAYVELWKRNGEVVGIDFGFLTLDVLGALFSGLSLHFEPKLDILGLAFYCAVGGLEIGIFMSHIIWYCLKGRKGEKIDFGSEMEPEHNAQHNEGKLV